jgi:hypothetical protein
MTHVDETTVHFAYRDQPAFAFMLITDGPYGTSPLAQVMPQVTPIPASAMPDLTGALLLLARDEAQYRPRIRPARCVGHASDGTRRAPRSRRMTEGQTVRPAHPTHLVIVSARRARPARLSASQPVAAAITATRAALYPEVPAAPGPQPGLRIAAHLVAITGVFMSLTETAVAQQMMALF